MDGGLRVVEERSELDWGGEGSTPYRAKHGAVYRNGQKYASYFAGWEPLRRDLGVRFGLELGDWSETAARSDRSGICLLLDIMTDPPVPAFDDCDEYGMEPGLTALEAADDGRVPELLAAIIAQDTLLNAFVAGCSDDFPPKYEWMLQPPPTDPPPPQVMAANRRLSPEQIQALFLLLSNGYPALHDEGLPPTQESVEHINRELGIKLPSSFVTLMQACPEYWTLCAGLGGNFGSLGHILEINSRFRNNCNEAGQYWIPDWLVLVEEMSMDGDAMGFDTRVYDEGSGEYPLLYWNYHEGKYYQPLPAHPDFLDYMEACLWHWIKHIRKDKPEWEEVQRVLQQSE